MKERVRKEENKERQLGHADTLADLPGSTGTLYKSRARTNKHFL